MNYPSKVIVLGQEISIQVTPKPIEVVVQGSVIEALGYYKRSDSAIVFYHSDDKPAIGGNNFVHELIEAIDVEGDLKLNHTQISVLGNALYQALSQANVDFKLAA